MRGHEEYPAAHEAVYPWGRRKWLTVAWKGETLPIEFPPVGWPCSCEQLQLNSLAELVSFFSSVLSVMLIVILTLIVHNSSKNSHDHSLNMAVHQFLGLEFVTQKLCNNWPLYI